MWKLTILAFALAAFVPLVQLLGGDCGTGQYEECYAWGPCTSDDEGCIQGQGIYVLEVYDAYTCRAEIEPYVHSWCSLDDSNETEKCIKYEMWTNADCTGTPTIITDKVGYPCDGSLNCEFL